MRPTTTDQNVRRRNEALAVYLDVALARDTDCVNEAALAALTEGHVQARGHGGQDYPTWVLSRCLLSVQEEARARLFLQEYVGVHRRETSPLPSYLGSLLNQLTASL